MATGTKNIKRRMTALFAIFSLCIMLLISRLFYLQIIKGPQLKQEAFEQQTRDSIISPKRGTIYDRNRKVLAQSATAETVTVSPREVAEKEDPQEVAKALSEILGLNYDDVYKKVTQNTSYVIIKKKIDKEFADKIRELNFTGVNLIEDSKRYYPYGKFASHTIGFTGTDDQGLEGLEAVLDSVLAGTPGRIQSAKNARGVDMPYKYESYEDPIEGTSVVLTIDEVLQHYLENHLEDAMIEYGLQNGAAAIMMDPRNGDILAIATTPDFDLNNPMAVEDEEVKALLSTLSGTDYTNALNEYLRKLWRNKAVVDSYEPGSTFKVITTSIALEEGLAHEGERFFCPGHKVVGGRTIHCWKTQGHGSLTFEEGLANSCNVVMMELAQRIGPATFKKYVDAFGFTQKTGFLMPGEASGIFHSMNKFNEVELATSSFGQGFQITPLQLVSAVSAIVNGGELLRPHIVKEYVDSNGNVVESVEKEVIRKVISEETSQKMRSMLENVVSNGTGRNAYIKGYRVGGKTGTSEKIPRGTDKRIASFIGVAPVDDPQVVCLVMLDEPTSYLKQGGQIAAPVVRKILEDALPYLGVTPQYTQEELLSLDASVPEVRGLTLEGAKKALTDAKFKVSVKGSGTTVLDQMPKPGARLSEKSTVILYTEEEQQQMVMVPDVVGRTYDDVKRILQNAGLNIKEGGVHQTNRAIAATQHPKANTEVMAGTIVEVDFVDTDVD